jgi:flagellar hook-basal body complex protein FliE
MTPLTAIPPRAAFEVTTLPLSPGRMPVGEIRELPETFGASPVTSTPGASFGQMLDQFVGEVNSRQTAAGASLNGLLSGQNVSLHQTMIAMEEASVSFQLMVEVRNKLLDAYHELMRMQV